MERLRAFVELALHVLPCHRAVASYAQVVDEDTLAISLSARGIGEVGYVAMGWGGLTMATAQVSAASCLGSHVPLQYQL